jgi:hypothetical protein
MTLAELREAYAKGELTKPLRLDDDQVTVYVNDDRVFDSHPEQLLEDALDLLGIPWEHV